MTHKDFLYNVQKLCQIDATHCSVLLNALCRLMSQAAVEQVPVVLPGLGKFLSHKHPEYIQEDPQTGQQTLFPPRISYRFYAEEEAIVNTDEEKNDTNNDILEIQLAEQAKMSVSEATRFVSAITEAITQALNASEEVEVHGLGTFRVVASRQGELQRIAYTPDEQMRNAVNAPFSCFEPVIIKSVKETATTPILANESTPEPMEDPTPTPIPEPINEPSPSSLDADNNQVTDPEPAPEPINEPSPSSLDIDNNQATDPEPTPKQPRAEATPVSIAEHYQEFADENKKTPLIRLLSVLLILACAALAWFIYKLEHPTANPYNRKIIENAVAQESTPIDTTTAGGEELYFCDTTATVTVQSTTSDPVATALSNSSVSVTDNSPADDTAKAEAERLAAEKLAKEKAEAEKAAAEKAAKEKAANDQKQQATATASTVGRLKKADGTYVTHKLGQGGRLTLVALEHYGDKAFWPYIYEVNRDKLKNPSLVQPGMVLYLPDPKHFDINANDPQSVAKAKAKAAQYLK